MLLGTHGVIRPVILALDFGDHLLCLPGLLLPLAVARLLGPPEELHIRPAVAAAQAVPERSVLALVVVEAEVVHGVAGGAVDEGAVGHVLAVVDQDGPEVHEDEQGDVRQLLQREQEGERVLRDGLREAVEPVEGVRGVGGRHDPPVVRLVQRLVDEPVVQAAVDPVDEEVSKEQGKGNLHDVVPELRPGLGQVIELAVPSHLARNRGVVRRAMPNMPEIACRISSRIWLLRYLGCFMVSLSKTKI